MGTVYGITNLDKHRGQEGELYKLCIHVLLEYYSSLTFSQGFLLLSSASNYSVAGVDFISGIPLNFSFHGQLWRLSIYHSLCHFPDFITSVYFAKKSKAAPSSEGFIIWQSNHGGEVETECYKKLLWKSGQVVEQAARGGGGVTVPRGVQETFRCCAERHGLVENISDR